MLANDAILAVSFSYKSLGSSKKCNSLFGLLQRFTPIVFDFYDFRLVREEFLFLVVVFFPLSAIKRQRSFNEDL